MSADTEREAFEAWAYTKGYPIGRAGNGYINNFTGDAYAAWMARAATPPAAPAPADSDLRDWMRNNMTFYNTAEQDAPVLASVSKRIWYHATGDMESYPFDAVIDGARGIGVRSIETEGLDPEGAKPGDTEGGARPDAGRVNAQLLEALTAIEPLYLRHGEGWNDCFERVAELFHADTGYLRPGKDCRLHSDEARNAAWEAWINTKISAVRAAIAAATQAGEQP